MHSHSTVYIVEDDAAVRRSLELSLDSLGMHVKSFDSAENFIKNLDCGRDHEGRDDCVKQACLVLDLKMPGMSGLELQKKLRNMQCDIPVIFISGHGGISDSVLAIKQGAVDFIEKPFSTSTLVARIEEALAQQQLNREHRIETRNVYQRFQRLTAREKEILDLITMGYSSKEIALKIHISARTVENHRARIMEKMEARNIVDLCRIRTRYLDEFDRPVVTEQF